MNLKHILTTLGSAFLGGAMAYGSAHITAGIPTGLQSAEAFALGMVVTGLAAVFHLYTPVPGAPQ
jgi:hypothetical protein